MNRRFALALILFGTATAIPDGLYADGEEPSVSQRTVSFRNLRIEFDGEPTHSAKTLPSGNHYVSYSKRSPAENGVVATYVFFTDAGEITDARGLLEKELNFAKTLRQVPEFSETLDLNGYPAARMVALSTINNHTQRIAIQSLLIGSQIVKMRMVGDEKDITQDAINTFFGKLRAL